MTEQQPDTAEPEGQPDDDDGPETTETLTVATATNADRHEILFGAYDERQPLTLPERIDDTTVRVKRLYEPVEQIEFDELKTREEVGEWLEENRDHDALDDVDWSYQDHRAALADAVGTRDELNRIVSTVISQLNQLPLENEDAQAQVDQLRGSLNEIVMTSDPIEIDRVASPELEGEYE